MTKEDLKQFEIDMDTTGTIGLPGEPGYQRFPVTAQVIPPRNYDKLIAFIDTLIYDANHDGYNQGQEAGENH